MGYYFNGIMDNFYLNKPSRRTQPQSLQLPIIDGCIYNRSPPVFQEYFCGASQVAIDLL